MKTLLKRHLSIAAFALVGATSALAADPFPSKPIRIIVGSAPGGLLDIQTRLVAKHLGDKLGQPVVVENRAGAGSLVAIRGVKASPADGYTLLATVNTVTIQQAVNADPGYDVVKDFVGVGLLTRSPFVLVASPEQAQQSVRDVLAYAKANPGKLTYGSAGNGSTTHLAAALFAQRAGIDLQHVPYKGNSAVWPDLVAGRVGMLFEGYGSGLGMIRDGKMKVLGVTSTKRLEVLPDVPTIAEAGVPGYNFYLWVGMLAPAGTPKDVLQKLSTALHAALAMPEVKARFRDDGSEVMLMSPDEFTRFLKDESTAMAKVVNDLNLPKQ